MDTYYKLIGNFAAVPNIKGVQAYMGVEAMCNTMMY
jgi:hypothetical protein